MADEQDDKPVGRPERVQSAIDFLKVASIAIEPQHKREIADLQFQIPENQWPEEVKQQRGGITVAGIPIPPDPMLSVAPVEEPIQLVANQERSAFLGINIHALNEDASDDTAEVLQGLYRGIEVRSGAQNVRSWAFDRAIRCGRGCYRILTEYDPDSPVEGDQRIVIKRVLYQDSVFVDPAAQEPDFRDMHKALVTSDVPFDRYKREYPKSDLAKYGPSELQELKAEWEGDDAPFAWVGGDNDATRTVRVAEYYELEFIDETKTVTNWKGESVTVPKRKTQLRWTKVNAIEELESRVTEARYIPIVMMIGRELQPVSKERNWAGMYRNAKDSVRIINYAASQTVKLAALEPIAPYHLDPRQIEGYESFWQQANQRKFPYLPSHRFVDGQDVGYPQRTQADMSRIGPSLEILHMGGDFLQGSMATFDTALGKQPTAHRSGRAIGLLQDQTAEATSQYISNEASISLPYEAMVILDLIPIYYDRPGRVETILDSDHRPSQVMLNAPFVMQQGQPQAVRVPHPTNPNERVFAPPDHPNLPEGTKHYNLKKGRYGVTVTIGKSSKNRLQQGQDALSQVIQSDPAMLMPLLGPEWLKFMDFPGAKQAAEIVEQFRAHQMPWLNAPQGSPDPRALAMENQALKQKLQEMLDAIKGKVVENQGKAQIEELKQTHEDDRAAKDREVKLAVAELGAKVERLTLFLEERARVGLQTHEAIQAEQDRGHEAIQAERDRQVEAQNAAAERAHEVGMGAMGHQQAIEQGDQAHGQALEQNAQQASLAPPTEEA